MRPTSATLSRVDDRSRWRSFASVHWGVLWAALALSVVGLATIHSASSELAVDYFPRQLAFTGVGLVAFLIAFSFDYHTLTKLSPLIYLLCIGALVAVLLFGHRSGGARSWFAWGGFQLQPAELAKIATALALARFLAGVNRDVLRPLEVFGATAIVAVPTALVAMERDLGGAAMFLPLLGGSLLIAGLRWKHIVLAIVVALLAGAVGWNFMLDYQRDRVHTFVSPERDPLGAGYQLRQSKIAVGSGQWTGRGYMQGTQSQLRFLPARHTDFIFAVLAEEWGFVGSLLVLFLYAGYVGSGARVAQRARDRTGILLVVTLLSGFAFHVLYNTAMVIGLVPVTGIPLPFLSYGGSFTVANFLAAGIILGVDFRRYVNR